MRLLLPLLACVLLSCSPPEASVPDASPINVADETVTDIDGRAVQLSSYAGRVVLIVNVASECGYTPQYAGLERLYRRFKDRGLVVLGFPSNDFGGQEPGSPDEIKKFTHEQFDVTFPLMEKVHAKGPSTCPLYKKLEKKGDVKWNFTKFLVDKKGNVVANFPSSVDPEAPELVAALEKVL